MDFTFIRWSKFKIGLITKMKFSIRLSGGNYVKFLEGSFKKSVLIKIIVHHNF